MNICLIDVDGHSNFPNYALMKIAAYHKAKGDKVTWFEPLFSRADICYASKVFTFTKDYDYFPKDADVIKGGTGYDIEKKLPDEIDSMFPDYSIYPACDYAVGFLTRGCINNCKWCIVPLKEGRIKKYRTIDQLARQDTKKITLMDNNFLASDAEFVKEQLELSISMNYLLDFNQALDCRLITSQNAQILAKVNWQRYIRFACDHDAQIAPMEKAVRYLRECGFKKEIFVYVLAIEFASAYKRVMALLRMDEKIVPFVMPYKSISADLQMPLEDVAKIKRLARWCNKAWIRTSCEFKNYK